MQKATNPPVLGNKRKQLGSLNPRSREVESHRGWSSLRGAGGDINSSAGVSTGTNEMGSVHVGKSATIATGTLDAAG